MKVKAAIVCVLAGLFFAELSTAAPYKGEPDPYGNSYSNDGYKAGWRNGNNLNIEPTASRPEACQQAEDFVSSKISDVVEKSPCVCGTGGMFAEGKRLPNGWVCVVYFKQHHVAGQGGSVTK